MISRFLFTLFLNALAFCLVLVTFVFTFDLWFEFVVLWRFEFVVLVFCWLHVCE